MFFVNAHHRQDVVDHARSLFGEDVVVKQYIDAYEKALSGNNGR